MSKVCLTLNLSDTMLNEQVIHGAKPKWHFIY